MSNLTTVSTSHVRNDNNIRKVVSISNLRFIMLDLRLNPLLNRIRNLCILGEQTCLYGFFLLHDGLVGSVHDKYHTTVLLLVEYVETCNRLLRILSFRWLAVHIIIGIANIMIKHCGHHLRWRLYLLFLDKLLRLIQHTFAFDPILTLLFQFIIIHVLDILKIWILTRKSLFLFLNSPHDDPFLFLMVSLLISCRHDFNLTFLA